MLPTLSFCTTICLPSCCCCCCLPACMTGRPLAVCAGHKTYNSCVPQSVCPAAAAAACLYDWQTSGRVCWPQDVQLLCTKNVFAQLLLLRVELRTFCDDKCCLHVHMQNYSPCKIGHAVPQHVSACNLNLCITAPLPSCCCCCLLYDWQTPCRVCL
jgi:hypothetical protein